MDHDNVPDDRAHTALGILREHTEEQVADEGDTAVVFYRWVSDLFAMYSDVLGVERPVLLYYCSVKQLKLTLMTIRLCRKLELLIFL